MAFSREFVEKLGIEAALRESVFYIELIDTLYLYKELIDHATFVNIDSVKKTVYQETGGYSLDYFVLKNRRSLKTTFRPDTETTRI